MQQRASHIATLLELKTMAEDSRRQLGSKSLVIGGGHNDAYNVISSFLQFVKVNENRLFYSGEEVDRKAREAVLCLERQRKAKQFLPISEF